ARSASGNVDVHRLGATYRLTQAQLESNDISADLMNGHLNATLLVRNLDTNQQGTLTAKIESISLDAVKSTLQNSQLKRLPVTGNIHGDTRASWARSIQNVRLATNLFLRGALWDRSTEPAPRFSLDGIAHVQYDGKKKSIALDRTSVRVSS